MRKLKIILPIVAGLLVIVFAGAALAAGPVKPADTQNVCGPGWGWGGTNLDVVSKLLGLTTEQIRTLRQEGKSLVQIAATKGVNEDALVKALLAARNEVIQKKVAAGVLTKEQADLMLKQMEQRMHQAVNRTTTGQPEWAGQGNCPALGNGVGVGGMNRAGRNATPGTGGGMMGRWANRTT